MHELDLRIFSEQGNDSNSACSNDEKGGSKISLDCPFKFLLIYLHFFALSYRILYPIITI